MGRYLGILEPHFGNFGSLDFGIGEVGTEITGKNGKAEFSVGGKE